MYLGIKATTGEVIVGDPNGVWLSRTDRRKTARERWVRSNLEMIVAVPWRKNEDDATMDGESIKRRVVMMDRNHKEKLEMEEHVQVPTTRCPGCMSLVKRTSETDALRKLSKAD